MTTERTTPSATPMRPPHLRTPTVAGKNCDTCKWMNRTTGECRLYSWPVKRTQVCDSWTPDR